ncbi:MAG TPA: HEAT repeat domain-containing protein, partial [Polyangiaceae bacterium]|nr:HEAT repeat domain-containing protein [Polyangiaceae bacterium]
VAYMRVAGRKTEVVQSLLADRDAHVVSAAAGALLDEPFSQEDYDLFERFALGHPKDAPVPDLPTGPLRGRVLSLLGRWLDESGAGGPKDQIIARLAEGHDRSRLPAIREALGDPSIQVRMSAASALATLRDADAIEPLEHMLDRDDNPYGRLAAANALVTLGAKRSAAVLAKVAARDTSWARSDLGKLSTELGSESL